MNLRETCLVLLPLGLLLGCDALTSSQGGAPDESSSAASCSAAPWAVGVAYATGAQVSYAGRVYACLQAHRSQSDWTPPAVPALWRAVGGTCGGVDGGVTGDMSGGDMRGGGMTSGDMSGGDMTSGGATGTTEYAPYFYTWGFGSSAYGFRSLMEMKARGGPAAVTLAFVLGRSGGAAGCTAVNDPIDGPMRSDIQDYRAAGGRVLVSFGGANGTALESDRACPTAAALAGALSEFVGRTGLTDLDFDVEQGEIMTAAVNQKRAQALVQLQRQRPAVRISFTLPAVPRDRWGTLGGTTAAGLEVLKATVAAGVTLRHVNLMTMDYGSYYSGGRRMGDLAVSALTDAVAQLKPLYPGRSEAQLRAMLGATAMIGNNDVAGEVFTLDDARTLALFAKNQGVGLVSFWAIQRDQPCPYDDLAVCSKVNQAAFDFHRIFKTAQ